MGNLFLIILVMGIVLAIIIITLEICTYSAYKNIEYIGCYNLPFNVIQVHGGHGRYSGGMVNILQCRYQDIDLEVALKNEDLGKLQNQSHVNICIYKTESALLYKPPGGKYLATLYLKNWIDGRKEFVIRQGVFLYILLFLLFGSMIVGITLGI